MLANCGEVAEALIFDEKPFAMSRAQSAIALVAIEMSAHYIGYEIVPQYIRLRKRRLQNEETQSEEFDCGCRREQATA
jgi:hypothetical protein